MICLVGNEKGGCGKTTLSVNIAAMAARGGKDVLLIDGDPGQQSAARWVNRRREMHPEAPTVHAVALSGRLIAKQIEDLAKRYATVIVDTGAEDSPELRAGATVADVLVIPCQPEALDLWTLPTIEAIVQRARSLNPKLRTVLALNRVPFQLLDSAPADVAAFVRENVPELAGALIPIAGRTAFGRAIQEGLGVGEMRRTDPKAVAEIERLYEEIARS